MSQLSDGSALHVPFFDLAPSHEPLTGDILEAVADLLGSGAFTNGPQVAAFEDAFADYCGAAHCVGTASGLDALRLALQALGLEPGAEVLVPAMTFIATFEAVTQAGGVPVPVDVSPADYCIDVAGIEAAIGPRTRMVMPVHLYGRVADMPRISALASGSGPARSRRRMPGTRRESRRRTRGNERESARHSASIPPRTSERSATPARW